MKIELPTAENPVVVIEGDCLDVLPLLPAGCVDRVITDPPYGIGWSRGINTARNSKPHNGILGDEDVSVRDAALDLMAAVPAVVFGSFYAPFPNRLKQVLVWHKPGDSGIVGSVTGFRRDAEPIFLTGAWPIQTCKHSCVFRSYGGQSATVTETGHPHTKPVDLIRQLVVMSDAKVVLDPFAGSGTTGVAAILEGRRAILIEKDPAYCEIIRRRIAETLCRPVTLKDGRTVGQNLFQEAR